MDANTLAVVIESLEGEIGVAERELENARRYAASVPVLQAELDHLRAALERYRKRSSEEHDTFQLRPPTIPEVAPASLTATNGTEAQQRRGNPKPGSIGDMVVKLLSKEAEPVFIKDIHSKLGSDKVKYDSLSGTLASYATKGWLVRTSEGYYTLPKG